LHRGEKVSFHRRQAIILVLVAAFIAGCGSDQKATPLPESLSTANPSSSFDSTQYAFPEGFDPTKHYLFYLHGKIIEDNGIPAVSPDYGEYEYEAILEKISSHGFVVISEQRAKNTDSLEYAKRIARQVTKLLDAGVPAKHITVVGASKGGGIAILASALLKNNDVNFVIMAICTSASVDEIKQNGMTLYGNVLSIYESSDETAGACRDLFSYSEGNGLSRHQEIVLNTGKGHGFLFQPLDEWVVPAMEWVGMP
jgi:hypothetical protein